MGKKYQKNELKVVFDTNALFNEAASDLLRQEISELIRQNKNSNDLIIRWYLAEIVRHERQYQMLQQALKLLNPVEKLERLLGHKLNITREILEQRVEAAINNQIGLYGLDILNVDHNKVDWQRMMLDAVYRRPPFESGEKEKGFRDALVIEAFLQLVDLSPKSSKHCWITIVTSDKNLADAVKNRTLGINSVRVLNSLEDLKTLINTISSAVDENFVADLKKKASKYFFTERDESTIMYKEQIREKIREKFKDVLENLPEGAEFRQNSTFYVIDPRFIKKEGRRVYWATKIEVEAKAYKYEPVGQPSTPTISPTQIISSPQLSSSVSISPYEVYPTFITEPSPSSQANFPSSSGLWKSLLDLSKEKKLMKNGFSTFEVSWSFNLNPKGRPSAFKIDDIKYIETNWS